MNSIDSTAYQMITPAEGKAMLSDNKNALLLDVRNVNEYLEKRIPGAVLIPEYELEKRAQTELPDKKQPIIVYCHAGNRSKRASKLLKQMGYENVYCMGGIISWPYETVSGQ